MGTFDDKTKQLGRMVGTGTISARVIFNQVYAQNQHESMWFKHPAGGQAKYLYSALMTEYPGALQRVAATLLRVGPRAGMINGAESIAKTAAARAPFEFADLKGSAHPIVTDGGERIYDRKPAQRRLNKAQHKAKRRLRYLGLGNPNNRWGG